MASQASRVHPTKAAMSLTESAAKRIKYLLSRRGDDSVIRIGVKRRGCNGLSYTLDYSRPEAKKFERIVEEKGVKLIIDPRSEMYILGTEMDFVEDKLRAEFVFRNPNEKGKCGCGESFNV